MTQYAVIPKQNDDKTWFVYVDGHAKGYPFSSFELASAHVHWLAMRELLELWRKGQAELDELMAESLPLTVQDFRDLYEQSEKSAISPADLKPLKDRTLELSETLRVFFVAHDIRLELVETLSMQQFDSKNPDESPKSTVQRKDFECDSFER